MRLFRKKVPPEPQQPKTSGQALKGDAAKTSSGLGKISGGIWDIASGLTSAGWHTYTSAFNPKARNLIGATALLSTIGYGAAQEELGAPSLGEIYKAAKDGTCYLMPENLEPGFCSDAEQSAEDKAVLQALQNG